MKHIDFHAHIYPDHIAEKASENVAAFYDMPVQYDGRVSTLLSLGEAANIDRFVVHSVATIPGQVESINTFIARTVSENAGKMIGFATLHPDYGPMEKEIDRAVSLGLRGVKIHPDFQRFAIDSPAACRIYEIIEGRLPILIHTGDFRYEYSKPERVAAVLDRFPRLDIIGAHFGGWSEWNRAARMLAGKRIYVDTSSSLYSLPPERARELISLYGADHVLFGSDYPMWSPVDELERLKRISLSHDEYELIIHGNAERLLKLL